ncbi:hypothetical protein Q3G72_003633 [Acer saccharum]|nr:hypothetical protein Q3G72_003633 [Acer saccharum]
MNAARYILASSSMVLDGSEIRWPWIELEILRCFSAVQLFTHSMHEAAAGFGGMLNLDHLAEVVSIQEIIFKQIRSNNWNNQNI